MQPCLRYLDLLLESFVVDFHRPLVVLAMHSHTNHMQMPVGPHYLLWPMSPIAHRRAALTRGFFTQNGGIDVDLGREDVT